MIAMTEFEMVLIGGSAGSLEPIQKITSELPADFAPAVFIAKHIAPTAHPLLVRLLQKHCKLPIKYPINEEIYLPSTVYIAPPGHHLLLSYQKVWIFPANFVYLPKPSIDLMMQSAANEFSEKAIGVLLSGSGNDGAIGIRAIKERGGITIVQSEASAQWFDMPNAAIATGAVDYILPSEEIPCTLVELIKSKQEEELQ